MRIYKTKISGGTRTLIQIGRRTYRANRMFIIIMSILASIAIMWPGYPLFAEIEPLILGLPLSFAWIILWVLLMFVALLLLYFSDNKEEETD